jgi:hypothetical protein
MAIQLLSPSPGRRELEGGREGEREENAIGTNLATQVIITVSLSRRIY